MFKYDKDTLKENLTIEEVKGIYMIFFRFEKNDGGGPYFTLDGINRITGEKSFDDTLDGCLTIQSLLLWFTEKSKILQDCCIQKYDGELLYINHISGNAIFKKSTAKKIK